MDENELSYKIRGAIFKSGFCSTTLLRIVSGSYPYGS